MLSSVFIDKRRKSTIAYFNDRSRPERRFDPINEKIRYPEVLVIGPNGESLGRMSSQEANKVAASYDLDLFCVAPNANPPVCKILNYGKFRFEKQKSERAQKKNSKSAAYKEVQLHISIGQHDLDVKAKRARGFLEDGDKVNIRVVLKGREMAHQDLAVELMKRFIEALGDDLSLGVEKQPSWEGKCYSSVITSKKK